MVFPGDIGVFLFLGFKSQGSFIFIVSLSIINFCNSQTVRSDYLDIRSILDALGLVGSIL